MYRLQRLWKAQVADLRQRGYQINDITYGNGMTAVDMGLKKGAISIGNYTAGPEGYKADWRDHTFVHEYGHYIQSQQHGLVYLLTVLWPFMWRWNR
jgi:hypothetical protein